VAGGAQRAWLDTVLRIERSVCRPDSVRANRLSQEADLTACSTSSICVPSMSGSEANLTSPAGDVSNALLILVIRPICVTTSLKLSTSRFPDSRGACYSTAT
jgi:hypothetical protein